MKLRQRNRRQFLLGAGGFTLALPFLTSVATRSAKGGQFPYAANPRFVCFTTNHGGVWIDNMYPSDSSLGKSHDVFANHRMHYGALQGEVSGGRRTLSQVLSAPSDILSDRIVGSMNVLRGLDIPFYIGHHTGGYLGNYARSDQGPPVASMATIDQVMAWSPSFYPDIQSVRERSLQIGSNISWGYTNASAQSGGVQEVPGARSSLDLFNSIFVADAPSVSEAMTEESANNGRTPVVDRVMEHYRYLRNGTFGEAKRMSSEDHRRLDDHMDRLSELQRRVNVGPASCGNVATPSGDARLNDPGTEYGSRDVGALRRYYQLFNDVIAAAFVCNTSRIATIHVPQNWSPDPREWHQEVAHKAHLRFEGSDNGLPLPQDTLVAAQQSFFEMVFVDLARKLDVEEVEGMSYLDNSLLMWAQESGNTTHDADSLPIVTAGSAAGFFNTGRYYDFRNRDNRVLADSPLVPNNDSGKAKRPGLLYNQWLATVLQSMNVPAWEFERDGNRGYGAKYVSNTEAWPSRVFDMASDILPMLRRA